MRILSLLPSATEMLFALGLGDQVVGVTFECDFPQAVRAKPQVVQSSLPEGLSPRQIDALVRSEGSQQRSLYCADLDKIEQLEPDLVILQDLCRVCALDAPQVSRDLCALRSHPERLTLSAHTLTEVFKDIERVGQATSRQAEAARLVTSLEMRVAMVRSRPALQPKPRVLALEWLDPFFQGGHWIPEMLEIAGGQSVAGEPGAKSVVLSWSTVRAEDPDVIVVMPCGYNLQATVRQFEAWTPPAGWEALSAVRAGRVFAVDGSAYFSRPGPRLVDGIELVAALLREEPGDYVRLQHPAAAAGTVGAQSASG